MKKSPWFKSLGWFFVPISAPGIAICLVAAYFCCTVFVGVDRRSHSAADTLYGIFPFFVCTFLMIDWIARRAGISRKIVE